MRHTSIVVLRIFRCVTLLALFLIKTIDASFVVFACMITPLFLPRLSPLSASLFTFLRLTMFRSARCPRVRSDVLLKWFALFLSLMPHSSPFMSCHFSVLLMLWLMNGLIAHGGTGKLLLTRNCLGPTGIGNLLSPPIKLDVNALTYVYASISTGPPAPGPTTVFANVTQEVNALILRRYCFLCLPCSYWQADRYPLRITACHRYYRDAGRRYS